MNKEFSIFKLITDKFISELEEGIIPWHKPWSTGTSYAISRINGKPYSLLNQYLLGKPGEWLSYKQIKEAHGIIRDGELPSYVVFWKFVTTTEVVKGNEVEKTFPILRYYHVWHISQLRNVEPKYAAAAKTYDNEPIDEAEKVVREYFSREKCKLFIEDRADAFYIATKDEIHVPKLVQHESSSEFYSTLFHEMVHSTGHTNRLNRKELVEQTNFGSEIYSKEELTAELGASFLLGQLGIANDKTFRNNTAYLQHWIKALKGDSKLIVAAASKAEAAAKYILAAA